MKFLQLVILTLYVTSILSIRTGMKTTDVASDETAILSLLKEKPASENKAQLDKQVDEDKEGKIVIPTTKHDGVSYECAKYASHINAALVKHVLKYTKAVDSKCALDCESPVFKDKDTTFLFFVNYAKVAPVTDKVQGFISTLSDKVGVLKNCDEVVLDTKPKASSAKVVEGALPKPSGVPAVKSTAEAAKTASKSAMKKKK